MNATANVIRIHPERVADACAECLTALDTVYHPYHFRKQTGGLSAPFNSRYTVISKMEVGDVLVFYATTKTARAATRGTAYNWGRSCGRGIRFIAKKLCAEHVKIERVE